MGLPVTMTKKAQSSLVVTKANSLIEASYKLSLNEQRLILACTARLDGRKPLPKDNQFELTADEFSDLFGVDMKNAYKEMEDAANNLYERDIRKIDGMSKKRLRWVYSAEYVPGEGKVRLGFSPKIAPYLTLLHRQFTSYPIEDIAKLQSAYHVRLFEMLMQFQDTGLFIITLDDFRERLQLEDKYTRFSNLKARIIDPAVKELSIKTPIDVTWEAIRKGRVVQRLEFRFEEKVQRSLL
ncbi:MAG: replication initiation protein [Candidatus Thiodiazotropha endolucinida]